MLTLLRLAFRNIQRNRSRSALTLGAIFFGVAMTLVLSGFGNGLGVLMSNDVIRAKVGAIQIHRRGYADVRDNQPLKLDMPQSGALVDAIRAVPGVVAASPRIVFGGLVNNGRDGTMFVGRGVDPVGEYQALPWAGNDVQGTRITTGHRSGAVLGAELARALGAQVGSAALSVQASTQGGQQNALDLEVAGTVDNANAFESKRLMDVPLAYAQELLRMPGRVTEWVVGVADVRDIDGVAGALRAALGADYEIETWKVLRPNIADVIRFQSVIVGIVSVVFLVIVVFGVVNTMVMSVLERTREIGTMMAVGMRRARISLLFVIEAATLAVIGGGLGAAVARGVVWGLTASGGIKMAAPGQTVERYHLVPVIPDGVITTALLGAVAGAIVAALYPAWKAARLRPVEALRAL